MVRLKKWLAVCVWLGMALLIATISAVYAAQAPRTALVVGNAAYQGESVLRNPVNDATDIAQALGKLGVQVFESKAHTNQSRQDMNALIGRFLTAAEGAELAVIFYAGHGIQSAGASYLLPTDAKITDERSLRTEGISLNDLLADGADKRISRLVVILDACRNNPYATRTRNTARGLAPPRETNGTLIAYATADGQVADDGTGRNGVYTEHLLSQLKANGQSKSIRDLLEDTQLAVTQAKPGQRPKTYGDSALFRDVGWGGKIQLASLGVEGTGKPVVDPEQEVWDLAKKVHTVAGYQRYLSRYGQGRYAQVAKDAIELLQPSTPPKAGQGFKDCQEAHCPELVVIPAGSFTMGSNDYDDEKPPHSVSVRSFALGKYEVTQGQWRAVMGSNPSRVGGCGDNCPVENVTWDDVQQYIQKLNQKTGQQYRLPSEAEWEYAARAGTTSKYWWGDTATHEYANYGKDQCCDGLAQGRDQWKNTSPVGQFPANAFDLYDMHGNVWEWVQDCYEDNYSKGQPSDGSAHKGNDSSCTSRVLRGGSSLFDPVNLRSANRGRSTPGVRTFNFGFRLARTVP